MHHYKHKSELHNIADILLDVATSLMGAGAHTSRVVANATRMAESFGYEVFFTIFQKNITAMVVHKESHESVTMVRAAKHMALNFRVISELSSLSWDTVDHSLSIDEVREHYDYIMSTPRMSRWVVLFLVAAANASFCRLFAGDGVAMALVFTGTLVGFFVRQEMMNRHMHHALIFIVAAFISSFITGFGANMGWGTTPDIAMATSVLFLIPGVPLINSIMDLLEGHVLTGISRMVNATILIISISIGVIISLLCLGFEKL